MDVSSTVQKPRHTDKSKTALLISASLLSRMGKSIIGLRFPAGPFYFLGLGSGISIPCFIYFGQFPVVAMSLINLAMPSFINSGPYLSYSAFI